jgi:hypothetical protein
VKGALAGAWLAGTGLVIWRQLRGGQHLPVPGALLAVTGLFAVLGVAADVVPAARQFIVVTAWGIDIAGVFNLWPAGLGGEVQQAAASGGTPASPAAAGTTQAPGTSTAAGRG